MSVLDLIFPKKCLDCGKEGIYICSDCLAKVRLVKPVCPYCQRTSIEGITHVKCRRKFGLDGLISVWDYGGVVRKAILALKYKYSLEVGRELSNAFVKYLSQGDLTIPKQSIVTSIPIHWYKENYRGFNQSDLIGKAASTIMEWKFEPDLLIKRKSTIPQAELKGPARKENLNGVFTLNSRFQLPNSVILFDDVFTTGSTLIEAAKTLKRSEVEKVWGLTVAR